MPFSGAVVTHFTFDAFGEVVSGDTTKTRYLYTGRELDTLTGLQYNRARWYDPRVGRWISEDPIGFAGGDVNLTRYVGNGAANATDPSGLWGIFDWWYGNGFFNQVGKNLDSRIQEINLARAQNDGTLADSFNRLRMSGYTDAQQDIQGLAELNVEFMAGAGDFVSCKAGLPFGAVGAGGGKISQRAASALREMGLEGVELAGKSYNSGRKALEKAGFALGEVTTTGRKVFTHPRTGAQVFYDSGDALIGQQVPHWHIWDRAGRVYDRSGRLVDREDCAAHIPAAR